MTMSKEGKKVWKVVGIIVGVVVLATLVQLGRAYSAWNDLATPTAGSESMALVLPKNYFPFNGTYTRTSTGKLVKA